VALPSLDQHPHAKAVLGAALDGTRASHAYLFHGPPGAGKRAAAIDVAAALISAGSGDPAGAARRVREGVHPDFTHVRPSGAGAMIKDDIEEPVVLGATRTPFESRKRVFVLEQAESMNDTVANRLLKTLEEPPEFVHLILVTDRLGDVLPTIVSRCQPVRFEAPTPQQLRDVLARAGAGPEVAEACARLGLGDADRAKRLALGDGPALRHGAEVLARAVVRGELHDQPWQGILKVMGDRSHTEYEARVAATDEAVAMLPKKEQNKVRKEGDVAAKRMMRRTMAEALDHGLQLTGLWLRDVACVVDGVPELAHHSDRTAELAQDAALVPDARALREAVALVDETRARFQLNVTEELALEALASRLERRLAVGRES
jgi:DNA polymerase III subunit delta'